jgi:hypothetical protein
MKRLGVLTAISHHRWRIVTLALREPETASRARPLTAETTLLQERHAVSRTTPAPRRDVETFPIGVDAGVEHLTTQQALPAEDAECRASRILQPDGHHQTMTTKAVHELTPGLDIARGFGTAYRRLHPPRSHGRRPGKFAVNPLFCNS